MRRSEVDIIDADGNLAWMSIRLPRVVPAGWRMLQRGPDGALYDRNDGLRVIVSGARESDGKRWIHVSCSRRDRLPDWADVRAMKDAFLGEDAYAVMVLPPKAFYVNLNPNVLHLYACADGHPLPEFSAVVAGTRTI